MINRNGPTDRDACRRIFSLIFKRFGLVVWFFSVVSYQGYMAVVHHGPGWTEGRLKTWVKDVGTAAAIFLFAVYTLFRIKKRGRLRQTLRDMFIFSAAIILSALLYLQKQNAEGFDMVFVLFLAFLSRLIISRKRSRDARKDFVCAWSAWFAIVLLNELLQHFLPYRKGQIGDVVYNTAGAGLGLLLGLKLIEL